MITLKQIAAEAGVSPMTVSNVIHRNYARVSPATVEKVQAIIEKYHYVPNMAARSLVGKSSRIVALLLPMWYADSDSLLFNPYVGHLVGALDMQIRRAGYYSMLCSFENVEQVLSFQQNWQIDGSILVLPHREEITHGLVEQTQTPLVVIDRRFDDIAMNSVTLNDRRGGYLATRYLLERGHRGIGFACPGTMSDSVVLTERYLGYVDAHREYGLTPDARWLFEGYPQREGGKRLGAALSRMEQRPTALVSTEDIMACGVIQALIEAGWRLPEDFSVVGFDDSSPAQLITPALTTVRQDVGLKAQKAFELLLEAIKNDDRKLSRFFELDVSMTERDSVASLQGAVQAEGE